MTEMMGKVTGTSGYKDNIIQINGTNYDFTPCMHLVKDDAINGIMNGAVVVFTLDAKGSICDIYDSQDRTRAKKPVRLEAVPGSITNEGVVPFEHPVEVIQSPGEVSRCVVPQTPVQVRDMEFDQKQLDLIKAKVAGNCTDTEFQLLLYMAKTYHLDPLLKQIWAVKFGDRPAMIYAGRDGFLEIAHRSGHFDGMKSWVDYDSSGKPTKAHCVVYRNDMTHPFESEVLFSEYVQPISKSGQVGLWQTKPSVMIIKVAESVALRKAFSVSGLYSPEEIP